MISSTLVCFCLSDWSHGSDCLSDLFAQQFYVLVLYFSVLVIPTCGRLSWPTLWSTFGRTIKIDWLIDSDWLTDWLTLSYALKVKLSIVTCPTYPEKFTRDNVNAPFFYFLPLSFSLRLSIGAFACYRGESQSDTSKKCTRQSTRPSWPYWKASRTQRRHQRLQPSTESRRSDSRVLGTRAENVRRPNTLNSLA